MGQVKPGMTRPVRVRRNQSILNSKHRSSTAGRFFVLPAAAQGTGSPMSSCGVRLRALGHPGDGDDHNGRYRRNSIRAFDGVMGRGDRRRRCGGGVVAVSSGAGRWPRPFVHFALERPRAYRPRPSRSARASILSAWRCCASTVGGYLAGRLRGTWAGVHNDEVYFRDTAHGLVTWALATVLSATVLGAAATHILGRGRLGCRSGRRHGRRVQGQPTDIYVDTLLRRPAGSAGAGQRCGDAAALASGTPRRGRPPVCAGAAQGRRLSTADRAYAAKVVSARTGLNPADAEQRVNDIIVQAKKAADDARKATAKPDAVARRLDAGRRGCVDPRRHRRRPAARLQMVRAGLAQHARPQSLRISTLERSETCQFFCGSWECRSVLIILLMLVGVV